MGKHFYMGLLLLVVLLALCVTAALQAENSLLPICQTLQQASIRAQQGQPEQAAALVEKAQLAWQRQRDLTSVYGDQSPIEEVNSLFSQLEYAEEEAFAARCRELACCLQAIADAQTLRWHSFL